MKEFVKNIWNRIKSDIVEFRIPLVILAVYFVFAQLIFGTVCPFRIFFHMPCPGCGLTHSCINILMFKWREAYEWNPAGFLWLPYIAVLMVYRYILGKKFEPALFLAIMISLATLFGNGSFCTWMCTFAQLYSCIGFIV